MSHLVEVRPDVVEVLVPDERGRPPLPEHVGRGDCTADPVASTIGELLKEAYESYNISPRNRDVILRSAQQVIESYPSSAAVSALSTSPKSSA